MAIFLFTKAILEGRPIRLFNYGRMRRDFTYVDDAVAAMARLLDRPPSGDPTWSGDNRSVEVTQVVELIESALGRKAIKELVAMQPGDVLETCADIGDLMREIGFRPSTPIEEGIRRFLAWYREFHRIS